MKSQEQQQEPKQKKTYYKPALVVYGNIREVTKNSGTSGGSDGGEGTLFPKSQF